MGQAVRRMIRDLLPGAIRARRHHRYLRRHHGLLDLGFEQSKVISPGTTFGRNCRLGGRVHVIESRVGDYSYIESDSRVFHATIGRFSAVANFAQVGLADHPAGNFVSTHPAFYLHRPDFGYDFVAEDRHREFTGTTLGNDVWIGAGVCVLDGVTIGDGAAVGAGSVVTRDIPPYAVAVGSPARVIRYRFDPDTIDFLLDVRWWDRPEAWLHEYAHLMDDVDRFRQAISTRTGES